MRVLADYVGMCMEMLDEIGIEYGEIRRLEVNTRAKNRWGQARRLPGGGFEISISAALLDEQNDDKGLECTILHELLHTCPGCMNHGKEWKRLADKVNRTYGYEISRAVTAAAQGITEEYMEKITYKYNMRCTKCGHISHRSRKCKFTDHPDWYTHVDCGGTFERI